MTNAFNYWTIVLPILLVSSVGWGFALVKQGDGMAVNRLYGFKPLNSGWTCAVAWGVFSGFIFFEMVSSESFIGVADLLGANIDPLAWFVTPMAIAVAALVFGVVQFFIIVGVCNARIQALNLRRYRQDASSKVVSLNDYRQQNVKTLPAGDSTPAPNQQLKEEHAAILDYATPVDERPNSDDIVEMPNSEMRAAGWEAFMYKSDLMEAVEKAGHRRTAIIGVPLYRYELLNKR